MGVDVSATAKLKRACEPCVQAKKRCDRALPTCSRCMKKRFLCSYHNEPLTRTRSWSQKVEVRKQNVRQDATVFDIRVDRGNRRTLKWMQKSQAYGLALQSISDPASQLVMPADSLPDIVCDMIQYPLSFLRGRRTGFTHPSYYIHSLPASIHIAIKVCTIFQQRIRDSSHGTDGALSSLAKDLLSEMPTINDFASSLTFVQSFCLLQIVSLLSPTATREEHKEAVQRQQLFATWCLKLWAFAPSELPSTLSPYEAYIFAESVRRTIMVAQKLLACYRMLTEGFYNLSMFVAALPFGARADLWDSEDCYADVDYGHVPLFSWREYCEKFATGSMRTITPFERMLLLGCRSKAGIVHILNTVS